MGLDATSAQVTPMRLQAVFDVNFQVGHAQALALTWPPGSTLFLCLVFDLLFYIYASVSNC